MTSPVWHPIRNSLPTTRPTRARHQVGEHNKSVTRLLHDHYTSVASLLHVGYQVGEHIGSKGSKLKHNPIDFTVPLQQNLVLFRRLWTDGANKLRPLPPPRDLVVLDHFSEVSSLQDLAAQGHAALSQHAELAAAPASGVSSATGGPHSGAAMPAAADQQPAADQQQHSAGVLAAAYKRTRSFLGSLGIGRT